MSVSSNSTTPFRYGPGIPKLEDLKYAVERLERVLEQEALEVAVIPAEAGVFAWPLEVVKDECALFGVLDNPEGHQTLYCKPAAFDLDDCLWRYIDKYHPDTAKLMEVRVFDRLRVKEVFETIFDQFPDTRTDAFASLNNRTDLCDAELGIEDDDLTWDAGYEGEPGFLLHVLERCGRPKHDLDYLEHLAEEVEVCDLSFEDRFSHWNEAASRIVWRYEDRLIHPILQTICSTPEDDRTGFHHLFYRCLACDNFMTPFIDEFSLERLSLSEQYGEEAKSLLKLVAYITESVSKIILDASLTDAETLGLGRLLHLDHDDSSNIQASSYPRLAMLSGILRGEIMTVSTKDLQLVADYRKSLPEVQETPESGKMLTGDCVVCMVSGAEYAYIPCGHRCICSKCVKDKQLDRTSCLCCRRRAEKVVRIFCVGDENAG